MKKIINLAIFLGIVCVLASAALYFSNSITSPIIEKNNKDYTDKLLKSINSEADEFKAEEIDKGSVVRRFIATKDGKVLNTIYELKIFGFQSDLKFLVAISPEAKFNGFQIISQSETPGYGTQIATSEKYQKQFTNRSIDEEIDTIAGSTITTSAVQTAVQEAVAHFKENK